MRKLGKSDYSQLIPTQNDPKIPWTCFKILEFLMSQVTHALELNKASSNKIKFYTNGEKKSRGQSIYTPECRRFLVGLDTESLL